MGTGEADVRGRHVTGVSRLRAVSESHGAPSDWAARLAEEGRPCARVLCRKPGGGGVGVAVMPPGGDGIQPHAESLV